MVLVYMGIKKLKVVDISDFSNGAVLLIALKQIHGAAAEGGDAEAWR